jgi:hypothetical protein
MVSFAGVAGAGLTAAAPGMLAKARADADAKEAENLRAYQGEQKGLDRDAQVAESGLDREQDATQHTEKLESDQQIAADRLEAERLRTGVQDARYARDDTRRDKELDAKTEGGYFDKSSRTSAAGKTKPIKYEERTKTVKGKKAWDEDSTETIGYAAMDGDTGKKLYNVDLDYNRVDDKSSARTSPDGGAANRPKTMADVEAGIRQANPGASPEAIKKKAAQVADREGWKF